MNKSRKSVDIVVQPQKPEIFWFFVKVNALSAPELTRSFSHATSAWFVDF
jgi:hypothetical protein